MQKARETRTELLGISGSPLGLPTLRCAIGRYHLPLKKYLLFYLDYVHVRGKVGSGYCCKGMLSAGAQRDQKRVLVVVSHQTGTLRTKVRSSAKAILALG